MIKQSSLLRNIQSSGGLFTENILIKLRDKPEQLEIGKIESFIEIDTNDKRKEFHNQRLAVFDWCKDKWDEISPLIDKWDKNEIILNWLKPFFYQFGYVLEKIKLEKNDSNINPSKKSLVVEYKTKENNYPYFLFIDVKEDIDSQYKLNQQNKSYYEICQQIVNFTSEIKWLFISNGKILRLLTKYYHTYSKGYLEFDLENIFANRDIKEFYLLYSIIHSSRFKIKSDSDACLIDIFQNESSKEGVKIGISLKENVQKAINLLGNELIKQNKKFQKKIRNDNINATEYYAELLRIIYRIIFILYAEQRDMLPRVGTLYYDEFSLSSIRSITERPIKRDKNCDLWWRMFLTFDLMENGSNFLEVTCFNGGLFRDENIPIIRSNNLSLTNDTFLEFIRLLTTSNINNVLQRINFLETKEEEIGSIYESLLDYKPIIDKNNKFMLIMGTERKSTGSYYTPKGLIDILIRTTLDTLVKDRLEKAGKKRENREEAILDLKICDPACGGGTFLLATLDFLGKVLAEIRSGSDIPSNRELREARREILQHCIYAVDVNPLAVELVKMSLWLRACIKDKPLNFLDNHIRCGNSLIGIGQEMEITRIDPNSFRAIKGNKETGIRSENSNLLNTVRARLKNEEKAKTSALFPFIFVGKELESYAKKFESITNLSENNIGDIELKEDEYKKAKNNKQYQRAIRISNIWTSTYFWPFTGNKLGIFPTIGIINQLKSNIDDKTLSEFIKEFEFISFENKFFHWYLEFPEVFMRKSKGFDCILTNPPWETLLISEREFFMGGDEEIFSATKQAERRKLIKNLRVKNYDLFRKYESAWRKMKKTANFLTNSGFYDLSARGTINTYALFIERCQDLISEDGVCGLVAPTAFISSFHLKNLFNNMIKTNTLVSLFDFQNRKMIFQIADRFRFCLLTLSGGPRKQSYIPMSFYSWYPFEIQKILEELSFYKETIAIPDDSKLILFQNTDFKLFNPNTITAPVFFFQRDYLITKHLYKQTNILIRRNENGEIITNPWDITFHTMFHMSNDSDLFLERNELHVKNIEPISSEGGQWFNKNSEEHFYPLYEGKMIWLFDHRYNSVILSKTGYQHAPSKTTLLEYNDLNFCAIPYYWISKKNVELKLPENYVKNWFLVFRSISNSANERTFISTIIPKVASVNSLIHMLSALKADLICCLLSNLNSMVFDYIVKQKISGGNLNLFIVEQLPVFPPQKYNNKLKNEIVSRVIKLIYTSNDLVDFAKECGYNIKPFGWNKEKRAIVQAELDAIFAHLYKLKKNDLEYIIDFFNVLKENEIKMYGEYKTKKIILEAYDNFSERKELFNDE